MAKDDHNAARAAIDSERPTLAQAQEFLRHGAMLLGTEYANRKAVAESLGYDESLGSQLIALSAAKTSPGIIVHLGFAAAARAAKRGLHMWPYSEIIVSYGEFEGAELFEFCVPSEAGEGAVTYYSHTQTFERIACSRLTLSKPIHLGLTSIMANGGPLPGRNELCDGERPSPQSVRAMIGQMQAGGRKFGGTE